MDPSTPQPNPQPPAPPPAPRRGVGAPLVVVIAVACAALGGGTVWLATHQAFEGAAAGEKQEKPLYQCPMHPSVTADHPSDCPICGMKLVLVKQEPEAAPTGERKIAFYRSPMDPKQTSHTPRKDEMGMDYLPVYEDEVAGTGAPRVEGMAQVTIDPARQQLIGLRTAKVTRGSVAESWRTVGRVQVDPTRVRKTNVKVAGYVERIYVDFVGRPVRKGEPLFSLYSPAVLSAQHEYLLAIQTRDLLAKGGALSDDGDALVSSARRKLELWDVPAAAIERLDQTGKAEKALTFTSPISGVVTEKNVVQGTALSPGDAPYEITDLGMVWVMADAYETDLARVKLGMPASFTLQAYPDRIFEGKVAFVDPLLDPKSRTAKVHMHFDNPSGELKPEMYGEVILEAPSREGLRIPLDAVVRSGTLDVVFLALGDGKFEPRTVQLGSRSGEQVEVVRGVEEGQEVVTRANFLIDSESQLRASLAELGAKQP